MLVQNGTMTSQLGQGEEYLVGTASANGYAPSSPDGFWYYILPNGDLYEETPPYSNTALVGVLVVQSLPVHPLRRVPLVSP